jgi:hypothetical protein
MAIIIKYNYRVLWSPSSYLAIDKAIIAYRGRTLYKIELSNKSIKESYKV